MRQEDIGRLQAGVVALAQHAGAAVMDLYRQAGRGAIGVSSKSDGSPVTAADRAAHDIISAGLTSLTPAIAMVSEEDEASLRHRVPRGIFWLVDPLDGTREFLARTDEFTVNIALIEDGRSLWGAVAAPALGLVYTGGSGLGAFRQMDGVVTPIRVSAPVARGGRCRVVASRSHLNGETADFISRLGAVDLVPAGSSLKFCRIAEGAADVYPRLAPTCEWDTAAAQAVLEGAGGRVEDLAGQCLRYGKSEVVNPSFVASSTGLPALVAQ